MSVIEQSCALLIVDMQKDFAEPAPDGSVSGVTAVAPMAARALSFFREREWPVFHIVREYRVDGSDIEWVRLSTFMNECKCVVPGTRGAEVIDELAPTDGEYRIVKPRFSAFMQTELDFMLRRLGVEHIVICGIQYPNCIRTTAYDGICFDYRVTVLTDATWGATPAICQANIIDMRNIGINCMTCDELFQPSEA